MSPRTNARNFIELQPIVPLDQWWQIGLFALGLALLVALIVRLIRRDSQRLPSGVTFVLSVLRVLAIGCLVAYALNPGLRAETRSVVNSRLALLIDTSLSLGLRDADNRPAIETPSAKRRIDPVIQWAQTKSETDSLRSRHDVQVYRFSEEGPLESIVSLPRVDDSGPTEIGPTEFTNQPRAPVPARLTMQILMAALSMAGLLWAVWIASWRMQWPAVPRSWLLAIAVLGSMACWIIYGLQNLSSISTAIPAIAVSGIAESQVPQAPVWNPAATVDWTEQLNPRGSSTAIGSAIESVLKQERGAPLAGIVLFTDGQSNAGQPVNAAWAAAANAGIPIFPVGLGSPIPPSNVELVELQAPSRVLPGDRFKLKAILRSQGHAGQTVQLKVTSVDEAETEAEILELVTDTVLSDDGQLTNLEFELEAGTLGRRRYRVLIEPIDGRDDVQDNQRTALVEVVQKPIRVLLIAGGPGREFRFLRNQLFRDDDVVLDVLLQSAKEGADQESDQMWTEFPEPVEGSLPYDCIVAFDPDWRALTTQQTASLERWVAEQAGGLILIAGPVMTPEWTRQPRGDETIDPIRRLYPVAFYSQGSAQLKLGRFGGREPFPLAFSREGRAARYLWLGDSAADSAATWDQFAGVYGYYAVNEAKPGADVLARFADPSTRIDDQFPIYLASQFYGAGRVFFQASGEMWRLRRRDDKLFENYYNQLIRWASQGRLLRDSDRGILLADRDRCWLGDPINIQAMLRDAGGEPSMIGQITAQVIRPDGSQFELLLSAVDAAIRPGTVSGRFVPTQEGDYQIRLPIPSSPDGELLTRLVSVAIPDLEKLNPQRNDALLSELAARTNGFYYRGIDPFLVSSERETSPNLLIQPQDQESLIIGSRSLDFQRRMLIWLLTWFTTALCLEWSIRRFNKLS